MAEGEREQAVPETLPLGEQARDALQRAADSGAEAAGAALAALCGGLSVALEPARVLPWEASRMAAALGGPDEPHVGVVFEVYGSARARVLVAVDAPGAARLAGRLLGEREAVPLVRTEARDAIAEMANIVASSYLTGLSRAANMTLVPSVPAFAMDSLGAVAGILDPPPELSFVQRFELAFVSRFAVTVEGGRASGAFVAVPAPAAVGAIAAARGV